MHCRNLWNILKKKKEFPCMLKKKLWIKENLPSSSSVAGALKTLTARSVNVSNNNHFILNLTWDRYRPQMQVSNSCDRINPFNNQSNKTSSSKLAKKITWWKRRLCKFTVKHTAFWLDKICSISLMLILRNLSRYWMHFVN